MSIDCICGKRMLLDDNENVCVWCGHGDADLVTRTPRVPTHREEFTDHLVDDERPSFFAPDRVERQAVAA